MGGMRWAGCKIMQHNLNIELAVEFCCAMHVYPSVLVYKNNNMRVWKMYNAASPPSWAVC